MAGGGTQHQCDDCWPDCLPPEVRLARVCAAPCFGPPAFFPLPIRRLLAGAAQMRLVCGGDVPRLPLYLLLFR